MRVLVDDSNGTIRLHSKVAIVLAVIVKYTVSGKKKGWYGSYQALADACPVDDISKPSAWRCCKELLELGLIKSEGESLLANMERINVVSPANGIVSPANDSVSPRNDSVSPRNDLALPPVPPSIYNINDKKEGTELAQAHACHAHPRPPEENLFTKYLAAFWLLVDRPDEHKATQQEDAARRAWIKHPDNRQLAYELIKYKHVTKKADPAFTIIDAQELRQNLPPPVNYYGLRLERFVDYYETYYNGQKGLYTADDVAFYKMPKPVEKFNI